MAISAKSDRSYEKIVKVISKPPKQDKNGSEINEAKVILRTSVITSFYASKRLNPSKESFDHPSSSVASKSSEILTWFFSSI